MVLHVEAVIVPVKDRREMSVPFVPGVLELVKDKRCGSCCRHSEDEEQQDRATFLAESHGGSIVAAPGRSQIALRRSLQCPLHQQREEKP